MLGTMHLAISGQKLGAPVMDPSQVPGGNSGRYTGGKAFAGSGSCLGGSAVMGSLVRRLATAY